LKVEDDEDWPGSEVLPAHDAVEVDERCLACHCQPQSPVVPVFGVGPPVAVDQQTVGIDLVFVRPRAPFDDRDGREADHSHGHVADPCATLLEGAANLTLVV